MEVCNICGSPVGEASEMIERMPVFDDSGEYEISVLLYVCPQCSITFARYTGKNLERAYSIDKKLSRLPTPSTNPRADRRELLESQLQILEDAKACSGKSRIIDLGCGQGDFLWIVLSRGLNVFGIDINENNILACRKSGFDVDVSDISDFYPKQKYSHAIMRHVLEHVDDPVRVLKHIKENIIEPNGVIGIEVPNAKHPRTKNICPYYQNTHKWYYMEETLEYVMRKAGFKALFFREVLHPHNSGMSYPVLQAAGINITDDKPLHYPELSFSPENLLVESMKEWRSFLRVVNQSLKSQLDELDAVDKRIAIWGTGGHTCALIKFTCINQYPITYLIDSSPARINHSLYGHVIQSPKDILPDKADLVVISAREYEGEIVRELKEKYPQVDYVALYNAPELNYVGH